MKKSVKVGSNFFCLSVLFSLMVGLIAGSAVADISHTITATAEEGGSIAPAEAEVLPGESVTFAIAADECHEIDSVMVDGETPVQLVGGEYTFHDVTEDHTIHATFRLKPLELLSASYYVMDTTLVLTFNHPVLPGQIRYAGIGFEANDSCEWDVRLRDHCGLTVQVDPTNPNTILIDVSGDPVAVTGLALTTLVHNSRINVLLEAGAFTDECGAQNEPVACPNGIPLDIECVLPPFTYIIVASAEENGAIAPSGNVLVEHGQSRTFTIMPDYGYGIDTVLVDEAPVTVETYGDEVGTYTFDGVTSNHTIYATFKKRGPFRITTSTNSGGTITPNEAWVEYGKSKTFIITPLECYYVEEVLVDEGCVFAASGTTTADYSTVDQMPGGSYTIRNVKDDHHIRVIFAVKTYTAIPSAGENGSINPDFEFTNGCPAGMTFTLTPNGCYKIAEVTVNGESAAFEITDEETGEGEYKLTYEPAEMEDVYEIHVSFEKIIYTIVPTAGEGGTIDPDCTDIEDCSVPVECGGCQTFAVLADPCYEIDQVFIDGELYEDLAEDPPSGNDPDFAPPPDYIPPPPDGGVEKVLNTYTFLSVRADHTIHATFKKKIYIITVERSGGGTVEPYGEAGKVEVECGTDITFTFTPNPCYEVDDVTVDEMHEESHSSATHTFYNVTEDHTLSVYFGKRYADVHATAGPGGNITPVHTRLACGSSQTFTVTPDDCYLINSVTVNGAPLTKISEGRYRLSLTADNMRGSFTVRATFIAVAPYTITASAEANGSITPEGQSTVPCGSDKRFAIIPESGYRIKRVEVDNGIAFFANEYYFEYRFRDVHEDHAIHAIFEPAPEELILLAARSEPCDRLLILAFNKPVNTELTRFSKIGIEFDDGGSWDVRLPDDAGLVAEAGEAYRYASTGLPRYPVTIDITCAFATARTLALAAFMDHKCRDIDLLLERGAFTATDGGENREADVPLYMGINGFIVGMIGDVTGDGEVTAYDAALILQSLVRGMNVFPIYEAALAADDLLAQYGIRYDVMRSVANLDGSLDGITSFDAVKALRVAAGLIDSVSAAPVGGMIHRSGRLQVLDIDNQNLEVAIDLDEASGVYSADIVMTYDPAVLTVTDVSRASTVPEWLFEQGATGTGQLRIALAGIRQPTEDGSLVIVSFDAVSADAIKQLELTEFKLNGGMLRTSIENLPKTFALMQNYPNPFNPETWIPFKLSEPADVAVIIYNVAGQMVRRLELGSKLPGHYVDKSSAAYWNGRNEWGEKASSGIYFYHLQTDRDTAVRKMIIVK